MDPTKVLTFREELPEEEMPTNWEQAARVVGGTQSVVSLKLRERDFQGEDGQECKMPNQ